MFYTEAADSRASPGVLSAVAAVSEAVTLWNYLSANIRESHVCCTGAVSRSCGYTPCGVLSPWQTLLMSHADPMVAYSFNQCYV
jgi:hypothetical protein